MGSDSCMPNGYNASLEETPCVLPRVLIVSRRTLRKNKFVDFAGEYHLDLIVRYGAVPIIVPRISGIHTLLESYQPIHGVLLCEGEDISPIHYDTSTSTLSHSDLQQIGYTHPSDAASDPEKDLIELTLAKLCLDHGIPFLGICRGSQVLNVACGGTLYQDLEKELSGRVKHVDYENYDGYRHEVRVVKDTPLHGWFGGEYVLVNSYHHQGVRRLGQRFAPMAFSSDGLIEGFYDPGFYDPGDGKFLIGLQFHPERMRGVGSDEFDHPGCPTVYQEFVKAVIAYRNKTDKGMMKNRRKTTVRSVSVAEDIRVRKARQQLVEKIEEEGVATAAKNVMEKMCVEELSELLSFYQVIGQICSDVLQNKIPASLDT